LASFGAGGLVSPAWSLASFGQPDALGLCGSYPVPASCQGAGLGTRPYPDHRIGDGSGSAIPLWAGGMATASWRVAWPRLRGHVVVRWPRSPCPRRRGHATQASCWPRSPCPRRRGHATQASCWPRSPCPRRRGHATQAAYFGRINSSEMLDPNGVARYAGPAQWNQISQIFRRTNTNAAGVTTSQGMLMP
jgi:hypothetical protein